MNIEYKALPDPDIVGSVRHMWSVNLPSGERYTYGVLIDEDIVDVAKELEYHRKAAEKAIEEL